MGSLKKEDDKFNPYEYRFTFKFRRVDWPVTNSDAVWNYRLKSWCHWYRCFWWTCDLTILRVLVRLSTSSADFVGAFSTPTDTIRKEENIHLCPIFVPSTKFLFKLLPVSVDNRIWVDLHVVWRCSVWKPALCARECRDVHSS